MKEKIELNKWYDLGGNSVMYPENEGWYISYNPNCAANVPAIFDMVMSLYEGEAVESGEETAIVFDGKFAVLEGDHRKKLEKCNTLKKAIKYFKSIPEEWGKWNTYKPE